MKHPFEVGETYKNRRGEYEVVKIDERRGLMLIRYLENGEEFDAKLQAQLQIWQTMSWEEQAEARDKAAEAASHQKNYGIDFTGLLASDFKRNTEGTTWRSRKGLAGRVARCLSEGTPNIFLSWAVYRWPVAFLSDREDYAMAAFEMGTRKAKFTIELDDENAYFGFYIERNAREMDKTWDWVRLLPALRKRPELRELIAASEIEHGVRFLGREFCGQAYFHFADGLSRGARALWDEQNPSALTIDERLALLEGIPANCWGEIYILGTVPKREAVQEGVSLAKTMADVMHALLPLYTAATRA